MQERDAMDTNPCTEEAREQVSIPDSLSFIEQFIEQCHWSLQCWCKHSILISFDQIKTAYS